MVKEHLKAWGDICILKHFFSTMAKPAALNRQHAESPGGLVIDC